MLLITGRRKTERYLTMFVLPCLLLRHSSKSFYKLIKALVTLLSMPMVIESTSLIYSSISFSLLMRLNKLWMSSGKYSMDFASRI